MDFEWDTQKDKANVEKHGISFEEAASIFKGVTLTRIDDRHDYGEIREISIGMIPNHENLVVVAVHTDRKGVIRIISARYASRLERSRYHEYCEKITR